MATRFTAKQVAGFAMSAGLRDPKALTIAVAIAGFAGAPHSGESGGDPNAVGDVGIQTSKWGPSVGLWQVRSLKAERGRRTERDELALHDPFFNARSMMSISSGGRNWTPWTVYTKGLYRRNLSAAAEGVKQLTGTDDKSLKDFLKSAAGGAVPDVGIPGVDVPDLGSIRTVFETLGDVELWKRIGIGMLGVMFMIAGIVLLFRDVGNQAVLDTVPLELLPGVGKVAAVAS